GTTGGDDRRPAVHRLDDNVAEALVTGRDHEACRAREVSVRVGIETREVDVRRQGQRVPQDPQFMCERPGAEDNEPRLANVSNVTESLQERVEPFLPNEAPSRDDHRWTARRGQPGMRVGLGAERRRGVYID